MRRLRAGGAAMSAALPNDATGTIAASGTGAGIGAGDGSAQRRRALTWLALVVLIGACAAAAWWYFIASRYESTDNAYVQGHVVQITPQVAGTVVAVLADDTDLVPAGQPLVKLDAADARIALEQAEAQLAQAAREVRGLIATDAAIQAQVAQRETEVARVLTDVQRAAEDAKRRAPLVASGAIGAEEYEHAKAQLAAAEASLASARAGVQAARQQLAAHRAQTAGVAPEEHPNVQRAATRVHEAWLALKRCEIAAPVAGMVSRRSVQLGQRIAAGAALMSVVALDQLWVDANFKESQLARLRLGQPVQLHADVYGKDVTYHGVIAGLGAGTGAAFALLPAQNATGNWIKIVQRVPVRIALDAAALKTHPLRVGLSMQVQVDVRKADGPPVAHPARAGAAVGPGTREASDAAEAIEREAQERVRRIVERHLGQARKAAAT
jgi:membrane fusion protein (multidrug efflux system)